MDAVLVFELALMGCVGGFLAGLLGIGGGMILVPIMSWILSRHGVPPSLVIKMAIATSLATICFTSMASLRAHHKRGAVRWPVVASLSPGIVLGSLLGAQIVRLLPVHVLAGVFALFVAFSGTQMLLDRKPRGTRELPGPAGMAAAGGVIGTVASVVGAGGGFLTVPFLGWCNVPIHQAVGTSAAVGFPIAVAGSLGYVLAGRHLAGTPPHSLGYLWLPALLVIVIFSMSLAPLGARAAHAMNVRQLKRAFALLLYLLAATMAFKAFGN